MVKQQRKAWLYIDLHDFDGLHPPPQKKPEDRKPQVGHKTYLYMAKQGIASGQAALGLMYAKGQGGLEVDFAAALDWLHKAEAQGYEDATGYIEMVLEMQKLTEMETERKVGEAKNSKKSSAPAPATSGEVEKDSGVDAIGYKQMVLKFQKMTQEERDKKAMEIEDAFEEDEKAAAATTGAAAAGSGEAASGEDDKDDSGAATPASSTGDVTVGERVVLRGLNKSAPDLNEKGGVVVAFDAISRWCTVRVDGGNEDEDQTVRFRFKMGKRLGEKKTGGHW